MRITIDTTKKTIEVEEALVSDIKGLKEEYKDFKIIPKEVIWLEPQPLVPAAPFYIACKGESY